MCTAVFGVVVRQENVNAKDQIFCAIRDVKPLCRVPTNSLFDLTIFINYLHYPIIMSMVEGFTFLFSTKLEFYCHTDDSFIKRSHFQCWSLSRFKKNHRSLCYSLNPTVHLDLPRTNCMSSS